MESDTRHIQVPNLLGNQIKPLDILVYASIKRYMNNKSREAFPSLHRLSIDAGLSINTIRKSIQVLISSGDIELLEVQGKRRYKFPVNSRFEPFSYQFLDKTDLNSGEKGYIMACQQYMFKDIGLGKISISNKELGDKINVSESSVTRYNRSLKDKGYLDIIPSNNDFISSLKCFKLNALDQAIVFKLQDHEDRINVIESEIQKTLDMCTRRMSEQEQLIEELKKQNELLKMKNIEDYDCKN